MKILIFFTYKKYFEINLVILLTWVRTGFVFIKFYGSESGSTSLMSCKLRTFTQNYIIRRHYYDRIWPKVLLISIINQSTQDSENDRAAIRERSSSGELTSSQVYMLNWSPCIHTIGRINQSINIKSSEQYSGFD